MTISLRWKGLDLDTLEQCRIIATTRDRRIRGAIVTRDLGLFYRIKLDETGATRSVYIERTDGKSLELFSNGAGSWSDDRAEPLPALSGCVDVDIWPTPLTNALPIWRMDWIDNQPQRFFMVWIDAMEMAFRRQEQVYTRLDATHFRYQSGDFERVLSVDDDGLVTLYPGLFERIA